MTMGDNGPGDGASIDWRCRLCGHWILVPARSEPLALLQQSAGRARQCVVHVDGIILHRCSI
jgi:hypothetical protein